MGSDGVDKKVGNILKYFIFITFFIFTSRGFADLAPQPADINNATFVVVPAGTFLMGSPTSEKWHQDDENLHAVTIAKDFEMQATDVTQAQWFSVMGYNYSCYRFAEYCPDEYTEISGNPICPNHPVDAISWDEAQAYIRKLNTSGRYDYRLPTEAEWERADRGGTQTTYSFGNDPSLLGDYAWTVENSDYRTHTVGKKKPNQYGLYDMEGNVYQWVQDWYAKDYSSPSSGIVRVLRGGAPTDELIARSAIRSYGLPEFSIGCDRGFRVVRTSK